MKGGEIKLGHGIDLVDIGRMEGILRRWGERFLDRIFTRREREELRGGNFRRLSERVAARFAAKEAVMKMLSPKEGISWHDIEIFGGGGRAPEIWLSGRALELARRRGLRDFVLSFSHSGGIAVASVVGVCDEAASRGGDEEDR